MIERQREAAHDGEAEAEALPALLARFSALELLEDRVAPLFGNAGPGVPDLDDPAPRRAPGRRPARRLGGCSAGRWRSGSG